MPRDIWKGCARMTDIADTMRALRVEKERNMSDTKVLNSSVPCKVIPMRNGLYRKSRRGVPECKAGELLFFLWHEPTGLFFKECYVNQAYAISKAARTTGPRGMSEVAEFWVTDTKHCEHSYRSEDET